MPDRQDYFRCPLCRGVTCEHVIVKRPNGTPYVTAFFSCTVCTLMFRDPRALTRGFEDRPRDGSSRNGPSRNGPSRNGPSRNGPSREGPSHDGPPRNDSGASAPVNRYQSWAKVNQDRKDRE